MSEESSELYDKTDHPAVDGVLESLQGLDETPVADQVPIFEAAHETLRAALSEAGNETH